MIVWFYFSRDPAQLLLSELARRDGAKEPEFLFLLALVGQLESWKRVRLFLDDSYHEKVIIAPH